MFPVRHIELATVPPKGNRLAFTCPVLPKSVFDLMTPKPLKHRSQPSKIEALKQHHGRSHFPPLANPVLRKHIHSHMDSSLGEKRTSLTAPRCPGSLWRTFPVRASHTVAVWSPLPATILSPFASQLALRRLRSAPVGAPSYVFIRRSAGAKGRTSHVRTVESCALDSKVMLSGESCNEVTVSVCPSNEYVTARLRRSQTLMSLSMPPVNNSLPASERAIAVMGKSVPMKLTASFVRGSHICSLC